MGSFEASFRGVAGSGEDALTRDPAGRVAPRRLTAGGVKRIESELKKPSAESRILLRKLSEALEGQEGLDKFDGESVELLRQVLKEDDKGIIAKRLSKAFPGIFAFVAPKAAGILTGMAGAQEGSNIVAHSTANMLARHLMADEAGIFSGIQKFSNDTLVVPFINSVARLTGEVASIPAGILAYFIGAGIAGGSVAVWRERKRSQGFEPIGELIDRLAKFESLREREGKKRAGASRGNNKEKQEEEEEEEEDKIEGDPRLQIIRLIEQYVKNPEARRKLANEEWVQLVSAGRRARVSLMREYTKSPRIVINPEARRALGQQEELAEQIIRSRKLAEVDLIAAGELLEEFNEEARSDAERESLGELEPRGERERLWNYAQVFVTEGYNTSGLPIFLRLVGRGARGMGRGFRVARKLRG